MYSPMNEDSLRKGLAEIPTPELSPGFDERILAACAKHPRTWFSGMMASLRPALAGAACALPIMLWLIISVERAPGVRARSGNPVIGAPAFMESALESPNLTPLSIRRSIAAPAVTLDARKAPERRGSRTVSTFNS